MIAKISGWSIQLPNGKMAVPLETLGPVVYRTRADARQTCDAVRQDGYPEACVVKVTVTVEVIELWKARNK